MKNLVNMLSILRCKHFFLRTYVVSWIFFVILSVCVFFAHQFKLSDKMLPILYNSHGKEDSLVT